eukprot:3707908-Prorocentrum_lima.AAC.1
MRSLVAFVLGGSTHPPSMDPGAAMVSPPSAAPQVSHSLPTDLSEDAQQPLVFVTFNVTSLAGNTPQTEWRTQLLLSLIHISEPTRLDVI